MSAYSEALEAVVKSVRPALQSGETTEQERAAFLYDLTREVYAHVKEDVHHHSEDTPERTRVGAVVDAALPGNL